MTCTIPFSGSQTKTYFVEETTCGVTPTSPVWQQLRNTSGNLRLTKDSLQSAELTGTREVADIRLGQNAVQGDFSVELSYGTYRPWIKAALGAFSEQGSSTTSTFSFTATVVPGTNRFTRSTGTFVGTGVTVGGYIKIDGCVNAKNNGLWRVVDFDALFIEVEDDEGVLVSESATAGVDVYIGSAIVMSSDRNSFSIMTEYSRDGGVTKEYHLTTGCEVTGFTFDCSVNALVTGTFNIIGRDYSVSATAPSGSTYTAPGVDAPYASVDGLILIDEAPIGYITSMSFGIDNAASPQYEIGNDFAAFIEQGRGNTTMSLSSFFVDSTLFNKFVNEDELSVRLTLTSTDGLTQVHFPRVVLTSGAPEVNGEGSITQTFDAQALAPSTNTTPLTARGLVSHYWTHIAL